MMLYSHLLNNILIIVLKKIFIRISLKDRLHELQKIQRWRPDPMKRRNLQKPHATNRQVLKTHPDAANRRFLLRGQMLRSVMITRL